MLLSGELLFPSDCSSLEPREEAAEYFFASEAPFEEVELEPADPADFALLDALPFEALSVLDSLASELLSDDPWSEEVLWSEEPPLEDSLLDESLADLLDDSWEDELLLGGGVAFFIDSATARLCSAFSSPGRTFRACLYDPIASS